MKNTRYGLMLQDENRENTCSCFPLLCTVKSTVSFFFFFFLVLPTFGQPMQDTLQEVKVHSPVTGAEPDARQRFDAGQKKQDIEKRYLDLYTNQSIAQLLAQQSSVFIKSYGINGMATLSFRGASAAQSAVLWEGVPITNPSLGVADVSLLQTGLFEQVRLQYGSSAALYGSGNVGGALILATARPLFTREYNVSGTLGAGSFGRKEGALKLSWQNERWRIALHGFSQASRNNFSYKDKQQQEQKLENARLGAAGILFSADYNLGLGRKVVEEIISLQLWWQQYERQIPPALFESFSVKEQRDRSARSLLHWRRTGKKSNYYMKASYNNDRMRYEDEATVLNSRYRIGQYYQELGAEWRLDDPSRHPDTGLFNGHHLLVFAPLQYATISGTNIKDREDQLRPAVAISYRIDAFSSRLQGNAALRQEWVDGAAAPILPGVGFSFYLLPPKGRNAFNLSLSGNVQRTYRIPTLNELYYFPGGNINLKPEQGWGQEAGYTFTYRYRDGKEMRDGNASPFTLKHELTVFHRKIDDWIYWLGGNIWTPYNMAQVKSKGMETDNKLTYAIASALFHLSVKWTYVLSTTQASYLPGDGSVGKQVPYSPRYNGQANVGLSWKNLFVNWNQTYTGYRFVTIDESQYLQPFYTSNLQAMYTLFSNNYTFRLSFQVQNILNERYEVVNARPMPGRYFMGSLQVSWKR